MVFPNASVDTIKVGDVLRLEMEELLWIERHIHPSMFLVYAKKDGKDVAIVMGTK